MSDEPTPSSDEAPDPSVTDVPVATPEEVEPEVVTFNVMSIESVLYDLSDSSPLVHLIEEDSPYRYLAIPIALTEAVALHNALDKIDGRRPATHELASEVLRRLNADIVAARITRYDGGVFYAELDLMTPGGRVRGDCRPSDGIVLALRMPVPGDLRWVRSLG